MATPCVTGIHGDRRTPSVVPRARRPLHRNAQVGGTRRAGRSVATTDKTTTACRLRFPRTPPCLLHTHTPCTGVPSKAAPQASASPAPLHPAPPPGAPGPPTAPLSTSSTNTCTTFCPSFLLTGWRPRPPITKAMPPRTCICMRVRGACGSCIQIADARRTLPAASGRRS